ncbi:GntP family permease [Nocardiopsis salina]|uniref:GntP family permease n=1 Tax=Nocardiopsis salina TaxID=245836 RepID=UPI00034C14C1|nr:GntP family permease [Nocardiopsis salina]
MLSMIGLVAALALLVHMTLRGVNIIVAALLSSLVLALTSGINPDTALSEYYMDGFTGYFADWFLVFLLGAIFGKVIQDTRSAASIADWISRRLGPDWALFAVVAACAVMTYGGVSLFVVGFTVYPIAVSLFRVADYPHRFIPAALVFGSVSFTMTSPGSPEIQNIIPTEFFGTAPTAGGWIGVFIGLLIMTVGGLWLRALLQRAVRRGETFELPAESPLRSEATGQGGHTELPGPVFALLPLGVVLLVLNVLSQFIDSKTAVLVALVLGIASAWVLNLRFVTGFFRPMGTGSQNALIAIANTCAVVGFGSVAAETPAFGSFLDVLLNVAGPPLMGLALFVSVVCGITGSASGGLGIALPIVAPDYMAQGVDPGAMHRVSALASGGIDSLPHNGYVVTTVRAISGETHKRAYGPIFMVSVLLPTAALGLAVAMYLVF